MSNGKPFAWENSPGEGEDNSSWAEQLERLLQGGLPGVGEFLRGALPGGVKMLGKTVHNADGSSTSYVPLGKGEAMHIFSLLRLFAPPWALAWGEGEDGKTEWAVVDRHYNHVPLGPVSRSTALLLTLVVNTSPLAALIGRAEEQRPFTNYPAVRRLAACVYAGSELLPGDEGWDELSQEVLRELPELRADLEREVAAAPPPAEPPQEEIDGEAADLIEAAQEILFGKEHKEQEEDK